MNPPTENKTSTLPDHFRRCAAAATLYEYFHCCGKLEGNDMKPTGKIFSIVIGQCCGFLDFWRM
jgi:hypothetical protein